MIHVRVGIHPALPPPDKSSAEPVATTDAVSAEVVEDKEDKPDPKHKPKK